MLGFLIYDVKVAALLAVFYMFYRLMLARETFHRVNRMVLLLTAIASFVLPLCVITMHETVTLNNEMLAMNDFADTTEMSEMSEIQEVRTPLWQILLPILFIAGMLASLGHTLMSMFRMLKLIKQSEKHPQPDGTIICVSGNANVAPFSWMHYIVMNRSDFEEHDAAILAHERGHIRFRHSWDLILVDSLTALQWFNPAMWMLRTDLRAIHEYEADGAVLSLGINARQYQYLLITKATGIGGYSLANGINHSTLKNRIHMMLHKKSQTSHLLKLLAIVPIVGVALAVNAETVTDYVFNSPSQKNGKSNATNVTGTNSNIAVIAAESKSEAQQAEGQSFKINGDTSVVQRQKDESDMENNVFEVVEQMPDFPGGQSALSFYLAKNIKYPAKSERNGAQGRVLVSFVVEKDGSLSNTQIVRSVDEDLNAEALRVVKAMPKWIPGKQKGKPIRVKYVLPITFRLQGDHDATRQHSGTPNDDVDTKGAVHLRETVVVGYALPKTTNSPYVIVDGKPIDSDKLKDIDPKTIERIEVLKDKEAIDKYGEKAKNGVIIVTTKK
jgi:TonB family protein